jgi:hypothetical protein
VTDHSRGRRLWQWLKCNGRWLLLGLGVIAVLALIHHVGWKAVATTLATAGFWLPVILLLEALWIGVEGLGLWLLLKPARGELPLGVWLRALMTHYTIMVILPAGRAGAEATRAAMFAPHIGGARSAAGATLFQGCSLIGNALVCIPALAVVAAHVGMWHGLSLLLLANLAATLVLGAAFYAIPRHAGIGSRLARRFASLADGGPAYDAALRTAPRVPVAPMLVCLGARGIQTLQYGVLLAAVGGGFTFAGAWISEGIHLVGAGLGDIVPNQVGVTEGAYRLFANTLGLGDNPERAISIALLARLSAFSLAGLYGLGTRFVGSPRAPSESRAPSEPERPPEPSGAVD